MRRRSYKEINLSSLCIFSISTLGRMSGCTHMVCKRLAYICFFEEGCSLLWLHCCIGFSLLRSAIDCFRGSHLYSGCPVSHRALDLALVEGQVYIP